MGDVAVLLVDDESNGGISLEKKLADQGMRIRILSREGDILSEIEKGRVDVAVVNLMVAGMNGLETLRRIKERNPLVEVILCTDQADLSLAIQGMEIGAFDYILKSISTEELVYKVMDAYQRKALQEEKIKKLRIKFNTPAK
jgi:DNA-binding NtrC family response regulator